MQVYKAIKYIRLSYTDDKTVESDSVANQRRLIDDYIARHPEIEVVAEKIDDGYSGVLFDRPAFQEMMRMIEQGEANCVIVKDLSRLGREYIETGRYMRRVFPAYGVRFIAINDNVDTENDAADQRYIGTYVIGKRKVKEIGSRHTQLKDESEWFKIPNHHPAIVSVDLFEKANASIKRFSLLNKKPRDYLLRGKVFCGCCDHAMSLRNGAWFYCRHSEVAETLPCHGVRIKMADLEQVVFETIRAQMCPALGIDSNKDKLDLQTVQQAEHEEKLRSIQDSKRHLYEQYALGEIDLETYRTRKAVYDTELVQAKNVHAVITAQTKQIKSDYEIKLKQQEIVQEVGNANMLTKALIDRLINKVYVFPGDRIEIEYATQDFLETKESEKEV